MIKIMKKNKSFIYLISLILLFSISFILLSEINESFINYKKCKNVNKALEYTLDKSNSVETNDNWDLYLPCSYTRIESELSNLKLNKDQAVFGISGTDLIASKNVLYDILKSHYGNNVSKYYPPSYVPKRKSDIDLFKKQFNKNKSYILKKNLQQQKGISLSNNYNELLKEMNSTNVNIIQELLEDPLIVGGRKINMRVYFLIVCQNNKKSGYIYNDGFIYYTREKYDPVILDFDHHITTGYIDRKVYEENPLTHQDLYKQLDGNKKGSSKILKNNIVKLMKKIFHASKKFLCNKQHIKKGLSFQLFGCDVAPDKDLDCKLIEINKGPDMGFKDGRDGNLKKSVMVSIFNLLDIDDDMKDNKYDNRFIPL